MKSQYHWVKTKNGDAPNRIPEVIRDFYPAFAELVHKLEHMKDRQEVQSWADSLTSTNCGWQEFEMAQFFLKSPWALVNRSKR